MPTAIITGSSRGIGRGIAISLAEAGHDIMINYTRNEDAAKEAAAEVASRGVKSEICQANVTKIEDGKALIDRTIAKFGRLDLLVNNAGIAPSVRADLLDAETDSYDEVMATNLRGPYFLTQYAANKMIEQKEAGTIEVARIVVISSISAFTASVNRGEYCISKTGLSMMTQLFADRLAEHGITVNEIQPGIIQTDMTGPVKEK
ncbi:MAG TPA: 3-ketoacyl-ACP reductase, partial [Candidatus Latescibacteria bacterium]|nr:3-ketoacyl-ACP reductase [Candidatus Latescibacterota bacterium]